MKAYFPMSALGIVLAFSGCGSSESDSTGPSTSIDVACARYADGLRAISTVCTEGITAYEPQWDAYEARQRIACIASASAADAKVTPDALVDCAAALKKATCGTRSEDVAECSFAGGARGEGEPCAIDVQCASRHCSIPSSTAGCGVCRPRAAMVEACSTTKPCVDGAGCDATSSRCAAKVVNDAGGSCARTGVESCATGAYCDLTTKTCTAVDRVGDACTPSSCASNLVCDTTAKTCYEPTTSGLGGPCGSTTRARCAPAYVCDVTSHQCASIRWVDAGGACGGSLDRCTRGFCNSANVCSRVIADGQPCDLAAKDAFCDEAARCIDGVCRIPATVTCNATGH